jgi:acetoin utilization deacetylase AcuC-like enzyme
MKPVGLVMDPRFEDHDTGPGHPERPERLRRIRRKLEASGLADRMSSAALSSADPALIARVHDPEYVRRVEQACNSGQHQLDSMDTAICAESYEIARLAAGSLLVLSDAVMRGEMTRGFAAVRPPGHHAERGLAMGFCLFNNVAIAARHLCDATDCSRVFILDWDVHHGNGTQHIFEEDPQVFYASIHQWPLYPGTGARSERGRGAGAGATLNCPLSPGAGDAEFLRAIREEVVPAALRFDPDFVLISAGFDAHMADPLANLEVTTQAYGEATALLCDLANRCAAGRLVSVLEGGYDLDALAESVAVHVASLLDHPDPDAQ